MPRVRVLIELDQSQPEAFVRHSAAMVSRSEASRQSDRAAQDLSGLDLQIVSDYAPVPLFSEQAVRGERGRAGFASFAAPVTNPDVPSATTVVLGEIDANRVDDLKARPGVRVYPVSTLTLYPGEGEPGAGGAAAGPVDCPPFQPPVPVQVIRELLGVDPLFQFGFSGQGVVVGILDEGINGSVYPVHGGFAKNALLPGQAAITSHGSMCAADVLVAAPGATLFDYPFLGIPDSGGALAMFQAVLEQRRVDGTPHVVSNSYGFVAVPPRESDPNHEIYDLNHPLHRKVREVVASGAPVFFAAGNCGTPCASGKCQPSGTGPGKSIHAANSLQEVITVAAVNAYGTRVGYSSIGPGMFEPEKPDFAAYTHFFGNFGPDRPGGESESPFDNGTSAACPVAAGVAALLVSVFGPIEPAVLKAALLESAWNVDGSTAWTPELGRGILTAAGAYAKMVDKVAQHAT